MKTTSIISLTVIAAAGMFALAGCGPNTNATTTPISEPTPVRVEAISRTTSGLPIRAVGRLEAKEELQLSFKLGGIIERVFVDEGDYVHKGQRLAALSLTEIEAALSQAQNSFDKAERDWNRYQQLFADSLVTLEQIQNASTAREVAKAVLAAARFNREHAEILAPSDGRILRRLSDDNELVAAGAPVVVMSGDDRGWVVRVNLADRDLMRVNRGDSALVEFDAIQGNVVSGSITEVGVAPNPANGTYEVEISVKSSSRLVSGLIAKVSILSALSHELAVVPVEALVTADRHRGFVFVPSPDNHTAAKVPVNIAYLDGNQVAFSSDLNPYARVITAGASKLNDGSAVRIIE